MDKLNALDVGGSITIHAFGAYYGLAASLVLSISGSGADHHKNGASYSSDMTAMIGTIFLWLFWVSHLVKSFFSIVVAHPCCRDLVAAFLRILKMQKADNVC